MQINSNQKTINKYEIPIAPYLKDLSSVAMYLDEMNFQLLTQIEPYKNNNIWTAVSLHGFGSCPSDIFKPGFTKNKIIVDTKLQWTTLRNLSVMKPLCEIVFNLPCDFERIRIMKLLSGKALKKHTDNIDNDIKNKKVVTSRRGPGGGYILNRKSSDTSLYEIITAVDENLDQTQCAGSMNCLKDKPCTTHHVWTGLNKIIQDYMKSITIEDVITNQVIHNLHDARESKTHVS